MKISKATKDLLLKDFPVEKLQSILDMNESKILNIIHSVKKEKFLYSLYSKCVHEIITNPDLKDGELLKSSLLHFIFGFAYAFKAYDKELEAEDMHQDDLEAEIFNLKNYIEFLENENCELKNGNQE